MSDEELEQPTEEGYPGPIQDALEEAAAAREALHADHASSRPFSQGYELVGLTGEFEFGLFCGLMPDLVLRPGGDKGIDFTVPMAFTVDVKTSRKAINLIHEQGKPFAADIYVLAEYSDECKKAKLIGWTWGHVLKKAPAKDLGYGVFNHCVPREKLRSMDELRRMMGRWQKLG